MLIAIAHIAGSILAAVALGVIIFLITAWSQRRGGKAELQYLATKLGISIDDLSDEKHTPKVIEIMSERYSDDRFGNRLSDLCGWLQTGWSWLGSLLQVGILIGTIWYTVSDSLDNAIYAWNIVTVGFAFWIVAVLFAFFCRLLTGRYPGQARAARKGLVELINSRSRHPQPAEVRRDGWGSDTHDP